MFAATEILRDVRVGKLVHASALRATDFVPPQIGALTAAYVSWAGSSLPAETETTLLNLSTLSGVAGISLKDWRFEGRSETWANLSSYIWRGAPLPVDTLSEGMRLFPLRSPAESYWCGFFLMACFLGRLTPGDEAKLTEAMVKSGYELDLRERYHSRGIQLARRYPTGGLSEKLALILPTIFTVLSEKLAVKAPFFVARSLSFTGGTWDKLSSIPGFRFPEGEEEIVRCLDDVGAAMLVTHAGINPADEALYQLRSLTCTVECNPLIVSSIASKHIAVPADIMLLDTRVGDGAFIGDFTEAWKISESIANTLEPHGISTLINIRANDQPDGSCIGNYLEVLESLEIITGRFSSRYDPRGMSEQLNICLDYICKIAAALPGRSAQSQAEIWHILHASLASGDLFQAHVRFLAAHGVPQQLITKLVEDGESLLSHQVRRTVVAKHGGQISAIDQRRLGYIVNDVLGAGANEYGGNRDLYAGVQLKVRIFDHIRRGDELCEVIGAASRIRDAVGLLGDCFKIRRPKD